MRAWSLLTLVLVAPLAAQTWNFERPDELKAAMNFVPYQVEAGLFCGGTTWDPYLYLALPEGGLDVSKLTRLSLRLYSSKPADSLAIYYGSPDGRWGLGSTVPIVAGWAEYRVDLTKADWHEANGIAGSNQWGGTSKRITSLRIDPGNQADRWVALGAVKLISSDELFTPGVTPVPHGKGRLVRAEATPQATAGSPITVTITAALEGEVPPGQVATTWLTGLGGQVARVRVQRVEAKPGELTWRAEFPTRRFDYPGTWRVQAALLGTELAGAGFGCDLGRVAVDNPLSGKGFPHTVLKSFGGDPAPVVDGRPIAPFFTSFHGERFPDQHVEMGRAGIHLFSDWFGTSTGADLGHVRPDAYDYTVFDTYFATALEADPDAWFLPHIGITPPEWWQKAHPEELCLFADGRKGPQSFASQRWREDAGADLRKLIAHLEAAPYASRIIGLCFYSGYTAEWQAWGVWEDHWGDYSAPALRAWHAWLARRYPDDAALQRAWGKPAVTRAAAPLPTPDERHTSALGALRDPATDQHVIDFFQFFSSMTATAITDFAKVVKEATGRRCLAGTYYGYLTQHNVRQQESSHNALSQVLASPDMDFVMSPPLYSERQAGGVPGFMSATESVQRHGKLWLSEADYRTNQATADAGFGRTETLAQGQAVLEREMGQVLAHRSAVSWYDMGGGWLKGPDYVNLLGRLRDVQQASLTRRQPFSGDMAVVIDETSLAYTTAMHPINMALGLDAITRQPRVGVSWDFYLLNDVVDGTAPPHKLYLFLNAFRLTEAQRTALQARLKREGATAVWLYAAGRYGAGAPAAGMAALTGMRIEELTWNKPLNALGPDGRPLGGCAAPVSPAFAVTDPGAEVLGKLETTDRTAVARKRMDGWTSVYSAVPALSPAFLRELARAAGCHLYLDTDDALSVDSSTLCVHAAKDGTKTVRLPVAMRVTDAVTGTLVAEHAREVTLTMKATETRLLLLGE